MGGYFPNPFKVLDSNQTKWTLITAGVSSATFVFSPVAMTVLLGEIVGSRVKHAYQRSRRSLPPGTASPKRPTSPRRSSRSSHSACR